MKINELMKRIGLIGSIADKISLLSIDIEHEVPSHLLCNLTKKDEWKSAREELKLILKDDVDGLQMLTCMLLSACKSYSLYKELNISDKIFDDTMKCFTRFVNEYKEYAYKDGFDRDFWCGRQLSLQLFRIQELEYELLTRDDEIVVDIHIPSDAIITLKNCISSFQQAEAWISSYYPMYKNAPYICESWLLSPALQSLLPTTSNILKFQSLFEIRSWNKESKDFLLWVYKCKECDIKDLPTHTSLQRNMKQYLLDGGIVGSTVGELNR